MSAWMPFVSVTQRQLLLRRRQCMCIILILLVFGITTQIYTQSSSGLLKRFALNGRAALTWTKESPKVPHPQNARTPPPMVQQTFTSFLNKDPTEPPLPIRNFPLEDKLVEIKNQNDKVGKPSSDRLLEKSNENLKEICQPKSHIVFLKTHKTAGSTIQNILFRYGEKNNLTFALPKSGTHKMFCPGYFSPKCIATRGLTEFDILCNHIRFSKSEVEKVMPEDSFYFSVLRHPVSLMESAFMFFKTKSYFREFSTLEEFLDKGQNAKSMMNNMAHNCLAFDLGYNNTVTADTPNLETIVKEVIAGIEQDFHLILISEYFDESMILLKHALCWSLEDVVSFKVNSRNDRSRRNISETTPEKIKRWNALDWRIYEYFNDTIWYKVRNLIGEEEMRREVAQLKELQAKMTSTCLEGGQAVNRSMIKDRTVRPIHGGPAVIQGYNLNPALDIQTKEKCKRMVTPELQYTRRLYAKQFPKTALKDKNESTYNGNS